jgi:HlyD family secretion protein
MIGLLSSGLLLGTLGVWSVSVNIGGAVIGKGTIEVSTAMTAVSHPIGGVVEAIMARNGAQVHAGDIVVTLDSFKLRSDLKVIEGDLFETLANIARREAEIEDRSDLILHPDLEAALPDRPDLVALVNRQQQQLDAHYHQVQAKIELLDEQAGQIEAQIEGTQAQLEAKQKELQFNYEELENAQTLAAKGLIKASEVFRLQRSEVTIKGEIGKLGAGIAELRGKISELRLKALQVNPDAREAAEAELTKLRPARTRFLQQRASLLDDLTKLEIRAPISGKIHDSQVQGVRSVLVAAKPLMMVVPDDDTMVVGVRVAAPDIDNVHVGQEASMKFKAFSGRDIPIILGQVDTISADVLFDPLTKTFYYDVKVSLDSEELAKLGEKHLIPGMPVEAFLSTQSRTPLAYVTRPLKAYFDRAFRDS